jgi:hypothetical protein
MARLARACVALAALALLLVEWATGGLEQPR